MENLIIIGTSTNAKTAFAFIKMHKLFDVIGFAVTRQYLNQSTFKGLPIYSPENLRDECPVDDFKVFVALFWNYLNRDRKYLYDFCKSKGYQMANLISPLAIIRGTIKGDNCWIDDYVIIQNDAVLESNIVVREFTLICDNSHVASHCFFGARSQLAGGCTIGEQSFVGLSATIFDDTTIGRKCIIGACVAVKRNMPDCSRYVTSSDNIVIKQYDENEIENKLVFSKNARVLTNVKTEKGEGGSKILIINGTDICCILLQKITRRAA